jgi:uncharacterized protein (TIGR03086 family)
MSPTSYQTAPPRVATRQATRGSLTCGCAAGAERQRLREDGVVATDVIALWSRVADGFGARLDAVPEDRWDDPTPCTEWTVRQLANHAVDSQRLLPMRLGVEIDAAGDDPKARWEATRAAALAAFQKPGAVDQTVEMPFGELTVAQVLTNVAVGDLLIHSWDLARATGGDEQLDAEAVATVFEGLKPLDEILHRSDQVFGPKIEPPPGADVQTELLCFAGRRP